MTAWPDDQIVFVSAVEHYSYCPRQCALIHVEKVFDENVYTMRGSRAHERVDSPGAEAEDEGTVERGLPIWSERLGLQGKADAVEFHANGIVYPVEYKHGPRKADRHDDLQLCAQALCLEEMLGASIDGGAVYHISSRRRREVAFTPELRQATEDVVAEIRDMVRQGSVPPAVDDARCPNCSLVHLCMPSLGDAARSIDLFAPTETEVTE